MAKSTDLVIVIDTSGSMKDEAAGLSQAALEAIVAARSSCPCDLRVEWFGIEGRWKNTQFERRIRDYLLSECNVSESDLRARKRGSLPGAGAQEDAARTIEDVSNHFDWREGTLKAIFYLGDEALEGGGDRTTDKDIEAANQAIVAAKKNEVIIHTYFGTSNSKYREGMLSEYARLAQQTAGQAFTDRDSLQGFKDILETVICGSQIERSEIPAEDTTDKASEESSPEIEMVESSVLSFDGKDDYIEIPYQSHLSPNQFTLSCWAKVTGKQKQWRSPVTCRSEGPLGGYILYAGTNDQWQFWTGNGEKWVTLTGSNVALRGWTHLAATYDGSEMRLYINGEQIGTPIESNIHLNQRFPLRIGAGMTEKSPGFFFMGQITEVRLWDLVRSEAEIKQFINCRLTGNEAGLVGYWPLNEGSGTTVKDLSGHCDDCNISGATWKQVKVPLQGTCAATEATTPEDVKKVTILWEIGQPQQGAGEFLQSGGWTPEYNYTVGRDADPINSPNLPGILTAPGSQRDRKKPGTEKLNIHFTLEQDYAQDQLTLFYYRYGAEEDSLFLDGNLLTKIVGKGEGEILRSEVKLGVMSQGKHTLTITTIADPEASDQAHQIDYFKLQATTAVDFSPLEQINAPSSGSFVVSQENPVSPAETSQPSQETSVSEPVETPVSPTNIEESPDPSRAKNLDTTPLSADEEAKTSPSTSEIKVPATPSTIKEGSTQQRPQSKILSIDGGGIRGIIPAMILAEIEKRTQQPIYRLFDLIAGTSTGGILALGLTKPSNKPNAAGQLTAQYSAEELVEMYVEYGGLMFYESLCGKVMGPIEDIFAQPKFSSEAKEEVITKYFGDTYLFECLKEVFIVSYDLEKRIPIFFTSNPAKQQTEPAQYSKLCQGLTLKDAAMATSATPVYFEPYSLQASCSSVGYYSYTLIDGGIVANNPARLAMLEAGVAEEKKQNDTLLLSLGAGCLTSIYRYQELKNWGLLQWTIPLLNTIFDGNSKLVAGELEQLLEPASLGHPGSYYRFQSCLSEELEALDNTLLKNVKGLQDSANKLIEQKTQEIDQLCEVLTSNVSC